MMEEKEEEIFYSPEKIVEEKDETNAEEKRRLDLMRATVEMKDPACKDIDDSTLRRFLRARDLDVEKASSMFMKYLTWRRAFVPTGSISESEITNEIAQNKMFMQGKDKQGRPIAVVLGARHFASKGSIDEFKRFLVFALDKLCQRMPEGQEKFTVIGDLQGYGYCNSDVRGNLAAINILQDYYPERLGKVFIIHVPYIFMTMWKIIHPFIDKNTRKKIVFVENKRLHATLREDIDESQLPKIYGGKLQLIPIQNG
ncbi:Phosphatidylinositol transfer protein PDR16 [Handroanthus impetiginosus]|uniref:Phosphatidylinositol transfer protein PDR16 n=1 Tax=Handroanthus impetiginosus TaxID=429701 RepID=A0A2G9GPA0_9LAMI|nr:Phosphatidylinositol transfer protein PDR16 [Handroanthus impetiginosus]